MKSVFVVCAFIAIATQLAVAQPRKQEVGGEASVNASVPVVQPREQEVEPRVNASVPVGQPKEQEVGGSIPESQPKKQEVEAGSGGSVPVAQPQNKTVDYETALKKQTRTKGLIEQITTLVLNILNGRCQVISVPVILGEVSVCAIFGNFDQCARNMIARLEGILRSCGLFRNQNMRLYQIATRRPLQVIPI